MITIGDYTLLVRSLGVIEGAVCFETNGHDFCSYGERKDDEK